MHCIHEVLVYRHFIDYVLIELHNICTVHIKMCETWNETCKCNSREKCYFLYLYFIYTYMNVKAIYYVSSVVILLIILCFLRHNISFNVLEFWIYIIIDTELRVVSDVCWKYVAIKMEQIFKKRGSIPHKRCSIPIEDWYR